MSGGSAACLRAGCSAGTSQPASDAARISVSATRMATPAVSRSGCKRDELPVDGLGQLDAALARVDRCGVAALTRKPYPFVNPHRRDERLDTLEIGIASGKRRRVDRNDGVSDARLVAGLKVRIIFVTERSAGQRNAQELHRER